MQHEADRFVSEPGSWRTSASKNKLLLPSQETQWTSEYFPDLQVLLEVFSAITCDVCGGDDLQVEAAAAAALCLDAAPSEDNFFPLSLFFVFFSSSSLIMLQMVPAGRTLQWGRRGKKRPSLSHEAATAAAAAAFCASAAEGVDSAALLR